MESIFKKGDIVRPKRALLKKVFHFPILRSEIMTVMDVHEVQYGGESSTTGVSVQDLNGKVFHFSQDSLEKI